MFKKKILGVFLFIFPLFGFWIYQLIVVRNSDVEAYREMLKQQEIASSANGSPTSQMRKKVQKDIWFTTNERDRLHYRILSESSLLTLTPVQNHIEVVESLKGITCWMQDKLVKNSEPLQQVRLFKAKDGIYRYGCQEFIANSVQLSLFRLPGHDFPKKTLDENQAFLQGVAENISLVFCGKTPQFQAKQFKATTIKE